jgi:hypothetical protein
MGRLCYQIWEHQIAYQLSTNKRMREFFAQVETVERLDINHSFYGGRTEVFKLYCKAEPGQRILYYDVRPVQLLSVNFQIYCPTDYRSIRCIHMYKPVHRSFFNIPTLSETLISSRSLRRPPRIRDSYVAGFSRLLHFESPSCQFAYQWRGGNRSSFSPCVGSAH